MLYTHRDDSLDIVKSQISRWVKRWVRGKMNWAHRQFCTGLLKCPLLTFALSPHERQVTKSASLEFRVGNGA